MAAYLDVTRGGAGCSTSHQEAGRGDGGEGEPHGAEAEVRDGTVTGCV